MAKGDDYTYTTIIEPDRVSPTYQPIAEKSSEEHTYETIPIDVLNRNQVGNRSDNE